MAVLWCQGDELDSPLGPKKVRSKSNDNLIGGKGEVHQTEHLRCGFMGEPAAHL